MRRRRKQFKFKYLMIFIFLISMIGTSYAYLSTTLNITGKISANGNYNIEIDPNLTLKVTLVNSWIENGLHRYQYSFAIKNISSTNIDNFKLQIVFNNNIQSVTVWDYKYTSGNKELTIINDKYDLAPNQTREVGFIVFSNKSTLKIISIKLTATTSTGGVDISKFPIDFNITSSWGNYIYQYNVVVTNKTGAKITYWEFDIELPPLTTYQSGWNAVFTINNNYLNIKNASHNGKLDNNESTNFGIQIKTNIVNFSPVIKNIKVR